MESQHVLLSHTQNKKPGTYLPVLMRFSNYRVKEPQYMEEALPLFQLSSIMNALVPAASDTGSTIQYCKILPGPVFSELHKVDALVNTYQSVSVIPNGVRTTQSRRESPLK
jgi:hypothetical protein